MMAAIMDTAPAQTLSLCAQFAEAPRSKPRIARQRLVQMILTMSSPAFWATDARTAMSPLQGGCIFLDAPYLNTFTVRSLA